MFTLTQFNRMFAKTGLAHIHWTASVYKELLSVGRSEKRLAHYFERCKCWPTSLPPPFQNHVKDETTSERRKRMCWYLKCRKDEEGPAIMAEVLANIKEAKSAKTSDKEANNAPQPKARQPYISCR